MDEASQRYKITVAGYRSFECANTQRVLAAMEQAFFLPLAGTKSPLPVGCRRGGCGVCRVCVLSGRYRVDKMSACHVNESDAALGYALACCLYPASDLLLQPASRERSHAVGREGNGGSPWQ